MQLFTPGRYDVDDNPLGVYMICLMAATALEKLYPS